VGPDKRWRPRESHFFDDRFGPRFCTLAPPAGAFGFVAKHRAAIDLIPAIQAVLAGDFFVSPKDEVTIDL
jgi:hypothetical protein